MTAARLVRSSGIEPKVGGSWVLKWLSMDFFVHGLCRSRHASFQSPQTKSKRGNRGCHVANHHFRYCCSRLRLGCSLALPMRLRPAPIKSCHARTRHPTKISYTILNHRTRNPNTQLRTYHAPTRNFPEQVGTLRSALTPSLAVVSL